ncbi:uncharacterized protein LOC111252633 [Varroa destructor]|uniref:Uncharacterized protein n=1 Tax=Varroa destructor TaxID=109461 RepID=A0A7M7KIV9_VARDE|nr:uncharacterized protein LOC111252633 [Varroa destructor]
MNIICDRLDRIINNFWAPGDSTAEMVGASKRRPSTTVVGAGCATREGDLSSLPPLIREKVMKDKRKPAELIRTDLITAMKIPDTEHLDPECYWLIVDPWKTDYDKGVQVPVNLEGAPDIVVKQRKDTTARDAILGPFFIQSAAGCSVEIPHESGADSHIIQQCKLVSNRGCDIENLLSASLQLGFAVYFAVLALTKGHEYRTMNTGDATQSSNQILGELDLPYFFTVKLTLRGLIISLVHLSQLLSERVSPLDLSRRQGASTPLLDRCPLVA